MMNEYLAYLNDEYDNELGICEECIYNTNCRHEDCGTFNYLKELEMQIKNELENE